MSFLLGLPVFRGYVKFQGWICSTLKMQNKNHPHCDLDDGGFGGGWCHMVVVVFISYLFICFFRHFLYKEPWLEMSINCYGFFQGSWPDLAIYSDSETFCNKFDSRLLDSAGAIFFYSDDGIQQKNIDPLLLLLLLLLAAEITSS